MLFTGKKSALIRLSDCIKTGVVNCLDTSTFLINHYNLYEESYKKVQKLADEICKEKLSPEDGERQIQEVLKTIPHDMAMNVASMQAKLHSECLSVILDCCFALESYINSLGYHLLHEKDLLGLIRKGSDSTAELLFDAIDKMSTIGKWETIGKLRKGKGFDKSKSPFQDLKILFNFRNDMVHDKVADYSKDRETKRYNRRLPDPVSGILTLQHVVYAADSYWGMVTEIHSILGTNMLEFHRHYNLKPWSDSEIEKEIRNKSKLYSKIAGYRDGA